MRATPTAPGDGGLTSSNERFASHHGLDKDRHTDIHKGRRASQYDVAKSRHLEDKGQRTKSQILKPSNAIKEEETDRSTATQSKKSRKSIHNASAKTTTDSTDNSQALPPINSKPPAPVRNENRPSRRKRPGDIELLRQATVDVVVKYQCKLYPIQDLD